MCADTSVNENTTEFALHCPLCTKKVGEVSMDDLNRGFRINCEYCGFSAHIEDGFKSKNETIIASAENFMGEAMDFQKVLEILENTKTSEYKVEYKDEDGDWWELVKDQPIRLLYERDIRVVKK